MNRHKWESLWACTLGQFVCKTCGETPIDCKGYINIE